jgi:signal peptidase
VRRVMGALLLGLLVAVTVAAAACWQQGLRPYVVRTGSMTPTYPVGSVVLDDTSAVDDARPGDVATFRTRSGLVTHRLVARGERGWSTRGDANRDADPWTVPSRHLVGVVRGGIAGAGYLLVFLQQPTGVPSLMVLCAALVLAWSVFFPGTGPTVRAGHRAP